MNDLTGRTISHYRILEQIGQGGMGVVYKAEDTRLKRTVALKFLGPRVLENEDEKTRFTHEAQAEAALDHPNICTIHGIEEIDGQAFIAMAYIDGASLHDKISSGALLLDDALDIVIQVAEGLSAAHEKGIVHRDIKPANIMITNKGRAKITDFGLARLPGTTRVTRTGVTIGTVAYMSPEQVKGNIVDHRTDIWSLGVVLYELLTGRLPFGGDYEAATLYSIINDEPPPAGDTNTAAKEDLDRVFDRALRKNPDERYQSVHEMLSDLQSARMNLDPDEGWLPKRAAGKRRGRLPGRTIIALAAALVIVLAATILTRFLYNRRIGAPVSVAVLDFKNHTMDRSFSTVLAELLITHLSQSRHVKILERERMAYLMRTLGIEALDDSTSFTLSRRAGIHTLVSPSILQIGNTFRINASVYDVGTEELIFALHVQGKGEDAIFGMIDELSKRIQSKLRVIPFGAGRTGRTLAEMTTGSMEAYKLYSVGQSLYLGGDPMNAIPYLESAIVLDSTFIEAMRALAVMHNTVGDTRNALHMAEISKRIAREKSPREFLKSVIIEYRIQGNWDQAIDYMERYLELEPDDGKMHLQLGYILSRHRKAFTEAIAEFNHFIELDPNNLSGQLGRAYNYLGHAYLYSVRYREAMEAFEIYQSLVPDRPDPLHSIAEAYRFMGEYRKATDLYSRIISEYPGYYESYEDLGAAYLAEGKWKHAVEAYIRFLSAAPPKLRPRGHVSLGYVYVTQGNGTLAENEIESALAQDSLYIQAHWLEGVAALRPGGEPGEAERALRVIGGLVNTASDCNDLAYHRHLEGLMLLAAGRTAGGLKALREAVELSPRNFIFFRKEYVRGLLDAGRTEDAIEHATSLLAINGNDAGVLFLLGLSYEREGSSIKASEAFIRARQTWEQADDGFLPLETLNARLEASP